MAIEDDEEEDEKGEVDIGDIKGSSSWSKSQLEQSGQFSI